MACCQACAALINAFVVSQNIPLGTDIDICIYAPEIICGIFSKITIDVIMFTRTVKLAIIYTSRRTITEETFNFAVAHLQTIKDITGLWIIIASESTMIQVTAVFLKFTIASRYSEVVVLVFQFSAVEGIAVLISIGARTAEFPVSITTEAEEPVFTAKIVIDFDDIGCNLVVLCTAIFAEAVVIRCYAQRSRCAFVNLSSATKTNTIIPRIIIFLTSFATLITITETAVASEFNVADFVFEVRYANAQVIQFVSIFVSQFVDQSALFNGSFVHVSHSFRYHFSCFITGDVALALEVFAVYALDDACVSQFYYGFVCPAVRRYVDKRVSCECTRCAYCHRCCQCC